MDIGYYKCKTEKGRNAEFPIHVMYDLRSWNESVLRQRGLLGNRVVSRPATPHEIDVVENNVRAVSYKYRNIGELIDDEKRAGSSDEFISLLRKIFT